MTELTVTLRVEKGEALSHQEVDNNFSGLRDAHLSPLIDADGVTANDIGKLAMFDETINKAKVYEQSPAVDGEKGKYIIIINENIADEIQFENYDLYIDSSWFSNPDDLNAASLALANYLNTNFSNDLVAIDTGGEVEITFNNFPESSDENVYTNNGYYSIEIITNAKPEIPSLSEGLVLGKIAVVEGSQIKVHDPRIMEIETAEDITLPTGPVSNDEFQRLMPRILIGANGGKVRGLSDYINAGLEIDKMFTSVTGKVGLALTSANTGEKILVRRLP